jgi:hypothetical protein
MGRGGVAAVMAATGMSSATLSKGIKELKTGAGGDATLPSDRVRKVGGGRKRARDKQPGLSKALVALVEPTARGDPEQTLQWTCKSTSNLASELRKQGFQVGAHTVAKELKEQEFSLQSNRKTREGTSHPDRNAQFAYINKQVMTFQRRGQPSISVDTKKKRKWWAISGIPGGSGGPAASRRRSACTTSGTPKHPRRFRMVCMI